MKTSKEQCILRHLGIKKKYKYEMGNHPLGRRITEKDFGDIAYSNIINVNQQCDVVKKNANFILGVLAAVLYVTQVVIILLFPDLVRPQLK